VSRKLFLPRYLESRAEKLLQLDDRQEDEILPAFDSAIARIEESLRLYQLDFPLFLKVDAWRSPLQGSETELWTLERIGWGKWKRRSRFLYVIEAIAIPQLDEAEILTVNSNSPPLLAGAKELDWEQEIKADGIQAVSLSDAPLVFKEKAYPFIPEYLFYLSDTLQQMDLHQVEFQEYMDQKVDEFVRNKGKVGVETRRGAVHRYFQTEGRAELFLEFLSQKHSDGS